MHICHGRHNVQDELNVLDNAVTSISHILSMYNQYKSYSQETNITGSYTRL
jgi:hypothetical protein